MAKKKVARAKKKAKRNLSSAANKRATKKAKKAMGSRAAPAPPPCSFVCSSSVWWPQGCSAVSGYYCPETGPPVGVCTNGTPTVVARSPLPAKFRGEFKCFTEYRFEKKTATKPAQFYMIGGKVPPQSAGAPSDYCAPTLDKFTGKKDKDAPKLKKIQQALEDSDLSGTILIEWNASIHECETNKHDPAHRNAQP